jgi:hypothetical protein
MINFNYICLLIVGCIAFFFLGWSMNGQVRFHGDLLYFFNYYLRLSIRITEDGTVIKPLFMTEKQAIKIIVLYYQKVHEEDVNEIHKLKGSK